jgi:hypothetical protein
LIDPYHVTAARIEFTKQSHAANPYSFCFPFSCSLYIHIPISHHLFNLDTQIIVVTNKVMAATHDLKASKLFDVNGWVCVVTGGGSGIGLMAAQALSANGM